MKNVVAILLFLAIGATTFSPPLSGIIAGAACMLLILVWLSEQDISE